MKSFEFKDQRKASQLTIKIAGIDFTFNPLSYNTKKYLFEYIDENKILTSKFEKAVDRKQKDTIISESCLIVEKTVDGILGKGSYAKIFKDRDMDFKENQEVLSYIFEQITEFGAKVVKENEHSIN